MLAHVRRILKPGGLFLLHVHHRWASLYDPGGWKFLVSSLWRSVRSS
jgi:SAM-dependent methyltransferase